MLPDFVIYILSVPLGLLILYWFGLLIVKLFPDDDNESLDSDLED